MRAGFKEYPHFRFSAVQVTKCSSTCIRISLRDFNSFKLPGTLLAAVLYRSLFFKMLSTVDRGKLNFLAISLVRAPSSLSSINRILVCWSVKICSYALVDNSAVTIMLQADACGFPHQNTVSV
jgi:hypothetical protein